MDEDHSYRDQSSIVEITRYSSLEGESTMTERLNFEC